MRPLALALRRSGAVACGILDRYATADSLDEQRWSTGRQGADVLRKAGFANVLVQTETFRGEFADAEDALAWATARPLAAATVAHLDPSRQQRFFSEARPTLAATSLSITFVFNVHVANRPRT